MKWQPSIFEKLRFGRSCKNNSRSLWVSVRCRAQYKRLTANRTNAASGAADADAGAVLAAVSAYHPPPPVSEYRESFSRGQSGATPAAAGPSASGDIVKPSSSGAARCSVTHADYAWDQDEVWPFTSLATCVVHLCHVFASCPFFAVSQRELE